jgi:DNA processing protein
MWRRMMMGGERGNRLLLALTASWVIPARTLVGLIRREGAACIDALGVMGISERYDLAPEARERLITAYEQTQDTERALYDCGARAVWLGEGDYPPLLSELVTPPPVLFVRGDLEAADDRKVAIVGSRRASISGMKLAIDLARELARSGFTVVSGLARGIDTAAHQGALKGGGRTVAVLGSGIDLIYPPENRELAGEISLNGAVISENGPGVEPLPWHFPLRNRIISGLSMGTVVVEASPRSGALITARCALEQNRSVFAVPGKPGDPRSSGVNKLLKDGAKLVEDIDDILEELAPQLRLDIGVRGTCCAPEEAGGAEGDLMDLLSDVPTHVDEISDSMGLDTGELLGLLLTLETRGLVKSLPGKFYVKG